MTKTQPKLAEYVIYQYCFTCLFFLSILPLKLE